MTDYLEYDFKIDYLLNYNHELMCFNSWISVKNIEAQERRSSTFDDNARKHIHDLSENVTGEYVKWALGIFL